MTIAELFIEGSDFEALSCDIALCHGDSLAKLRGIRDATVDCVITDPPYFIDGMGSSWDMDELNRKKGHAGVVGALPIGMKFDPRQGVELQRFTAEIASEIFRILKPGGFYLSFSQGRLYHRMTVAIEDAGFEIRDMLVWQREGQAKAFSQDHFVRKMDISEDEKSRIIESMGGRKTPQLKGQSEPIVLAQKPREGTFVENWMEWGVGLIDTTASIDGKFPGTVIKVEKPRGKDREVAHLRDVGIDHPAAVGVGEIGEYLLKEGHQALLRKGFGTGFGIDEGFLLRAVLQNRDVVIVNRHISP